MTYTLDRFEDALEDAELAVLTTDARDTLTVPRAELPPGTKEGDVLVALPWYERDGEVRFAVDAAETARRRQEAAALRAALPRADEGDLEL